MIAQCTYNNKALLNFPLKKNYLYEKIVFCNKKEYLGCSKLGSFMVP